MSGAPELQFEAVAGRLRTALELRSFNALAKALGMSSSAFANRKKSGSLPLEAIVRIALEREVNLDWIFTGQGSPRRDSEPRAFELVIIRSAP